MPSYYKLIGKLAVPCSSDEWVDWMEDHADDRHVGDTLIANEIRVSTVFLGLDHNIYGDGPPVLFETMIFGKDDGGGLGDYQERCSTWYEAEVLHEKAVMKATAWAVNAAVDIAGSQFTIGRDTVASSE